MADLDQLQAEYEEAAEALRNDKSFEVYERFQ